MMALFIRLFSRVMIFNLLFLVSHSTYAIYPAPVTAKNGLVVSEHALASQVGVDILKKGGNAIDAAVAVGYALAVVNPCCGNIGGGGFMLIHLANGKNIFLNFREKAPLAAKPDMYLDKNGNLIPNKSINGYLAIGVPGTVLGLDEALKRYGSMKREDVMAPAILLADNGFQLSDFDLDIMNEAINDFRQQQNVAAIFLKNNRLYDSGDILIQKNLAHTLKLIAKAGPDAFYKGDIAKEIVAESKKNGGILSEDDFAQYSVEEYMPITCTYRGYVVTSSPPPSSGGTTLCEILNILEPYPLDKMGFHSAQGTHFIVEAMRNAFADRNNQLGDPLFVKNPVDKLISKEYAAIIRKRIKLYRATPSSEIRSGIAQNEKQNTTHYSVVDNKGNAVSVTYTLNGSFGARVIALQTGFFLNNEMDDFATKVGSPNQFGLVQGVANNIEPRKTPLSSMTPTILTKNGQLFMVVGSPGGPRIITSVLQTILNVLDYGMDIESAVDAPRFHQQWLPDVVYMEPFSFSADTEALLIKRGYTLQSNAPWSAVEAIYIDPITKKLYGGSDNRRPAGGAIGY